MVAGHLQEKRGIFHIVLSYVDESGKRRNKWISTGLPVKGNKKKAEELLRAARRDFVPTLNVQINRDMLFADFLEDWLEVVKPTIRLSTFASYSGMAKSPIGPYFRSTKATLSGLQPWDIQSFYNKELKRVKANTVIHYHAVIRKALKYAVKIDLIEKNPADKVERPKIDRFSGGSIKQHKNCFRETV
jgi:hypothetical protein